MFKFCACSSDNDIFTPMTGSPLVSLTSIPNFTGVEYQSISIAPKLGFPKENTPQERKIWRSNVLSDKKKVA